MATIDTNHRRPEDGQSQGEALVQAAQAGNVDNGKTMRVDATTARLALGENLSIKPQ